MILDLFAGPGGWDCAMPGAIGIEHDASACATRAAAGHLTIRADVSTWPTPDCRVSGLMASPPCQTFSAAGNRDGIAHLGALMAHVRDCVMGWRPFTGADSRTTLVLEPLRFALETTPDWIALEQVPDVLPIWEAYAYTLRALGWSVWTGILNSADFGVPQTRRRAILMAHRRKSVQPPEPTHCEGGAQTMFGELLPWVSMAEALGWGGFETRWVRGAGAIERHGDRPPTDCSRPAPTLTDAALGGGGGGTIRLHTNRGQDEDGNRQTRDTSEPAPAFSSKSGAQWAFHRPATTVGGDPRISPPNHHNEGEQGRGAVPTSEIAPWAYDQPSTTIAADPRCFPPGHFHRRDDDPENDTGAGPNGKPIKLTVRDALILQSFPADYPVQGTKTKQFEQIGNAVPPKLARAILTELAS